MGLIGRFGLHELLEQILEQAYFKFCSDQHKSTILLICHNMHEK
jgi:hypothetical protein